MKKILSELQKNLYQISRSRNNEIILLCQMKVDKSTFCYEKLTYSEDFEIQRIFEKE